MSSDFPNIEWKISQGLVPYEDSLAKMSRRAVQIRKDGAPELIWLLEHPHIYTCGTSAKKEDILLPDNCSISETDRGGQVTYHGPGQRVVYVLLDLEKRKPDIRAYIKQLEEWVIQTLKCFDIQAFHRDGRVGLWVPRADTIDDKIAAIGVRIKKWVTMHGVAINVCPDLDYYKGIVPCGIKDHGVTSMKALGHSVQLSELDSALKKTFTRVFDV